VYLHPTPAANDDRKHREAQRAHLPWLCLLCKFEQAKHAKKTQETQCLDGTHDLSRRENMHVAKQCFELGPYRDKVKQGKWTPEESSSVICGVESSTIMTISSSSIIIFIILVMEWTT
jgi:hypothetical protein